MEDKKLKKIKLLSEIQSLSESIRRKHRALKRGIAETTTSLEKTFHPLVEPLKTLTKQFSNKNVKEEDELRVSLQEKKEEAADDGDGKNNNKEDTPLKRERSSDETERTPRRTPRFLHTRTLAETPPLPATQYLATPEGRQEGVEMLNLLPLGTLAKEYMKRFITDTRNTIDTTYGPRYEGDILMIGDGKLEFDKNDMYIKGTRYAGTQGLYELIFMKIPDEEYYGQNDLKAYKSILIATNAHRQRYQPDSQINSNRGYKYRNIIQKLFGKTGGGGNSVHRASGLIYKTVAGVDYVHWNDVNELVDRLRLLIASQRAGHTGHDNEIVSIIEELREAKVII